MPAPKSGGLPHGQPILWCMTAVHASRWSITRVHSRRNERSARRPQTVLIAQTSSANFPALRCLPRLGLTGGWEPCWPARVRMQAAAMRASARESTTTAPRGVSRLAEKPKSITQVSTMPSGALPCAVFFGNADATMLSTGGSP